MNGNLHSIPAPAPAAARSPWMDEKEVAAWTGFTRGALQSMRYEGRGPAFSKPGNRIRYRREDVDAWMETNTSRPRMERRRSA